MFPAAFVQHVLAMPGATGLLAAVLASACACGTLTGYAVLGRLASLHRTRRLRRVVAGEASGGRSHRQAPALVVRLAQAATARPGTGARAALPLPRVARTGSSRVQGLVARAGLAGEVSVEGFARARLHYAGLCAAAGGLACVFVAPQAAVVVLPGAAVLGWLHAPNALRQMAAQRSRQLEAHLSEAVEVVCLGLRGGLSFDRSLGLYCQWFDTLLARELAAAQGVWQAGVQTREQSLRALAVSYDSEVLARVVDSIVRSMRYGTPLADSLEVLAGEARASHRAQVQEQVMKAPVKMMVPIGVLILPSMLLLVMGPVLLELAGGL